MKRISTLLIVISMVLVFAAPVWSTYGSVVSGDDTYSGAVTVSFAESMVSGGTVTVDVIVTGSDVIQAAMLIPVYDSDVFEILDFTFNTPGAITDVNEVDAVILWEAPSDPNGHIASFTLKAKEDAAEGTYEIGCTVNVRDENDELYSMDATNKHITIKNKVFGDINGDGKVNARDKAALTTLIKNGEFFEVADLNFDGKVNARDKAVITAIIKGTYKPV